MTKIWLIARKTYQQRIRSATFLILAIGLPLLMVGAGAISVISVTEDEAAPLGYVDQTGQLPLPPEAASVTAYETVAAAETARTQHKIEGYLVLSADYFQGAQPAYHSTEAPNFAIQASLTRIMRQTLLADHPAWAAERLENPTTISYIARDTGQTVTEGFGLIVQIATPAVLALFFALTIFTGAGQMGLAVIQEKEQRAMEMIITSLAPWQLVTGKILGITMLTATQTLLWITAAASGLGLAWIAYGAGQPLTLPWYALGWAMLLGVPGYFLYAVIAAGLGIIAGDRQQARQLSALLGFVGLSPLYFMGALVNALDGPLAIALTWFPLTAPVVAMFRLALTPVPAWQLGISLLILSLSLIVGVWVVARIFRTAMLMYGQTLQPKQIWRALYQQT